MNNRQEGAVGPVVEQEPDQRDYQSQAALLIDFDNVTMGIRSNLGQEFRKLLSSDVIRGNVAVQRAYADWRRYPQYIVPLSEASIDLIFAPAYGSSKKNATDIRLAIDALELVFTRPEIKTFILMSGDSDFSSLVLKLKEYGKYVIGVGIQESSSDLLVQNCDEYYSYSALAGLKKAGEEPAERHDPWVLVEKAILKMVERNDTMRSDRLKQVMLEIDPSFNEKEHGFTKFNRFVVDAASRGLLSIQKMDAGQYAVAPGGRAGAGKSDGDPRKSGAKKTEGKKTEPRKDRGQRRGGRRRGRPKKADAEAEPAVERDRTRRARAHLTFESAVELLNRSLDQLLDGPEDSVRDSDVKRRMLELDEDFDEGEIGFNKFSKFLQEVDSSGGIELTKGPSGNYHVSRPVESGEGSQETTKRAAEDGAKAEAGAQDPEAARKQPARADAGAEEAEPGLEDSRDAAADESAVKRLARRLFGSYREEGPGTGPAATSDVKAQASRQESGKPEVGDPAADEEERPSPRAETRSRPSKGQTSPKGERARSSREGRTRDRDESRASTDGEEERGDRGSEADADAPRSGKVRSERSSGSKQPEAESAAGAPPASTKSDAGGGGDARLEVGLPDAPRGTIRGRYGTRGRYRPPDEPPPILEGQTKAVAGASETPATRSAEEETDRVRGEAAAGRTARGDLPRRPEEIISYLRTRYVGVGEKTAEALVEAFSSDLFRILDEEPERVREVLSDHRAERVLEAWSQDPRQVGE